MNGNYLQAYRTHVVTEITFRMNQKEHSSGAGCVQRRITVCNLSIYGIFNNFFGQDVLSHVTEKLKVCEGLKFLSTATVGNNVLRVVCSPPFRSHEAQNQTLNPRMSTLFSEISGINSGRMINNEVLGRT